MQIELLRFVDAVKCLVGKTEAILLSSQGQNWEVVASSGNAPTLRADKSTDGWLRMIASYGDVVHIERVPSSETYSSSNSIRIIQAFQIFVAVKDDQDQLVGAILLMLPADFTMLSAAQNYALQTYASDLHNRLSLKGKVNFGAIAIERLRLLESVVVNAKDAIIITEAEPIDQPGPRIVYCNPAFLETTGFSVEEVIGKTPRILQCEESDRATLDKIRSALEKWEPVEVEVVNARRDGSRFWIQLSIVPVADEKGWFTHWVSVQRDITERKIAEEAMRQSLKDREERISLESRLAERERIQEQLAYTAFHDELTKLKNRIYFNDYMKKSFSEHQKYDINLTLMYLDLDKFKYINDGMGHHAGDAFLKEVAARLEACAENEELVARIGGDEFALIFEGAGHLAKAIDVAEKITSALSRPLSIEGQVLHSSCSIGIASLGDYHSSAQDLIRDADVAMYASKKNGRGRHVVFDISMRQASLDALVIRNSLKYAITRNELYLVFQPIFALPSHQVVGAEALLRWKSPSLGNVSPDRFISVAEENDLIYEIGQWVMRKACQEAQTLKIKDNDSNFRLSVNVSAVELNRKDYAQQVSIILEDTGLDPSALQIEITESVFLNNPVVVEQTLHSLQRLGVRIALDDFGTGYSALGYIDRYPIDVIKIDRSFVCRMMNHDRSTAIVKSILSLGQALGADIVAEGIETEGQLAKVATLGCSLVQGYLLSPPLLADDFRRLEIS